MAPYQEWYKPRLNSSSDCLFINTEIFNFGVFGVVLNSAHQTHTHHRSKFHAAKHRLRTQNITSNFSEARLTLRLLISYIYGAPSKARNANVVYIYGPTFGNAETVSFYFLHNVSTLNQCREVSFVTFVCKHFAS